MKSGEIEMFFLSNFSTISRTRKTVWAKILRRLEQKKSWNFSTWTTTVKSRKKNLFSGKKRRKSVFLQKFLVFLFEVVKKTKRWEICFCRKPIDENFSEIKRREEKNRRFFASFRNEFFEPNKIRHGWKKKMFVEREKNPMDVIHSVRHFSNRFQQNGRKKVKKRHSGNNGKA